MPFDFKNAARFLEHCEALMERVNALVSALGLTQEQAEYALSSPALRNSLISNEYDRRRDSGFPIPKSWPKWKKEAAKNGAIYHTSKPDLDNLKKHIKDCMSKMSFWRDDSQVFRYSDSQKTYYGNVPGWDVTLIEMKQPKSKKEWEQMNGERN